MAAVGLAAALSAPARAADEPPVVHNEIATAERYCAEHGGKLREDPGFPRVLDINGDGGEDWILDFSKFHCANSIPPEPFCGSGGCNLMIFLWKEDSEWTVGFEETVQKYRLVRRGRRLNLQVWIAGNMCGKIDAESCKEEYRFEATKLVRVGGRAR
jgi:hypothetical protein